MWGFGGRHTFPKRCFYNPCHLPRHRVNGFGVLNVSTLERQSLKHFKAGTIFWFPNPRPEVCSRVVNHVTVFTVKEVQILFSLMPTKVRLVKAMVFPVVMHGCESWTIKKAEHQRIDGFELWCWRRLLRVPWTARRSNQSILKEMSAEYSLQELMLKLKLQYFGHLMERDDSLENTLMLGKIEGRRRRRQRMRWLDGITDLMDMSLSRLQGLVMSREAWHSAVHGVTKNWT